VIGGHTFVEIRAGVGFGCARDAAGAAWCWGDDGAGQLGDGAPGAQQRSPVQVELGGLAVALSTGTLHACARDAAGALWCWGSNEQGAVGDASTLDATTPAQIFAGGITTFGTGYDDTCAAGAGSAWCWGWGSRGQLGDAMFSNTNVPVAISAPADALAVGQFHVCARTGGTLTCWGENSEGQLGNGIVGGNVATPASTPGITGVTDVIAGDNATCALFADHHVGCWGGDTLGDGTHTPRGTAGTVALTCP
jgi:alpha-tubulin suppressor-like RCC1 family protein